MNHQIWKEKRNNFFFFFFSFLFCGFVAFPVHSLSLSLTFFFREKIEAMKASQKLEYQTSLMGSSDSPMDVVIEKLYDLFFSFFLVFFCCFLSSSFLSRFLFFLCFPFSLFVSYFLVFFFAYFSLFCFFVFLSLAFLDFPYFQNR